MNGRHLRRRRQRSAVNFLCTDRLSSRSWQQQRQQQQQQHQQQQQQQPQQQQQQQQQQRAAPTEIKLERQVRRWRCLTWWRPAFHSFIPFVRSFVGSLVRWFVGSLVRPHLFTRRDHSVTNPAVNQYSAAAKKKPNKQKNKKKNSLRRPFQPSRKPENQTIISKSIFFSMQ